MTWQTEPTKAALSPAAQAALNEAGGNIDTVIWNWLNAEQQLQQAKTREMLLRQAVVELKFGTLKEGVNRIELGAGYSLKATGRLNYNLDKDNVKVEAALDRIEALGNEGTFLADRLIKWRGELSVTEYRKLVPTSDTKKIIDEILTITPGTPALEMEQPKEKT